MCSKASSRSACNAWAVGFDTSGSAANQTLIEHWDGSAWKVLPSPDPGSIDNVLYGVRAVSSTSIWAVGNYADAAGDKTLVLHWNGTAWKQVPSPGLGDLFAVDAVSAHDAWAVGETANQTHNQTLILHRNGTKWKQALSPNARSGDFLTGVAATSTSSAWAAGADGTSRGPQTLVLRWNGTKWKRVASPSPGTSNELFGIGATSAASAWAVGTSGNSARRQTLILRWNGRKWARVTSPSAGAPDNVLNGVTVTSASNAWAVGDSFGANPESKTLILHWNGRTWQRVASPDTGDASDKLWAVAATSARNAWVGRFQQQHPGARSALLLIQRAQRQRVVSAGTPCSTGGRKSMKHHQWPARRIVRALAGPLVMAGVLGETGFAPASASPCESWTGGAQPPSPGTFHNSIFAVAALSSCNAWAVGYSDDGASHQTLMEHWDRSAWKVVTGPDPGSTYNLLTSVRAVSTTSI
jgi:hypothetical protein